MTWIHSFIVKKWNLKSVECNTGFMHDLNNRNSTHAISISYRMVLSALWEIFFEFFFFRHISRAEGEWNIENKKNEKNISIMHEFPCDNWFIISEENMTKYKKNTTLRLQHFYRLQIAFTQINNTTSIKTFLKNHEVNAFSKTDIKAA